MLRRAAKRALLYMPGSNLRFLEKAQTLKVDALCFDLEDAVPEKKKVGARSTIVNALESFSFQPATQLLVRLNSRGSGFEQGDIEAILNSRRLPDGLVLPKVMTPDDIHWVEDNIHRLVPDTEKASKIKITALIEHPRAILGLPAICSASKHLDTLIFGADDYANEIGATRSADNHEVATARQMVVMNAATYGLEAIDLVFIDFKNPQGLAREAADGFHIGYTGKQIIHPSQIDLVQSAFGSGHSPEQLAWAARVVEGAEKNDCEAFSLDGVMIDQPTIKLAQKALADAHANK